MHARRPKKPSSPPGKLKLMAAWSLRLTADSGICITRNGASCLSSGIWPEYLSLTVTHRSSWVITLLRFIIGIPLRWVCSTFLICSCIGSGTRRTGRKIDSGNRSAGLSSPEGHFLNCLGKLSKIQSQFQPRLETHC